MQRERQREREELEKILELRESCFVRKDTERERGRREPFTTPTLLPILPYLVNIVSMETVYQQTRSTCTMKLSVFRSDPKN